MDEEKRGMVYLDVLAVGRGGIYNDFHWKATNDNILWFDALHIIVSRVMRIEFQDFNDRVVVQLILELLPLFDTGGLRVLKVIEEQSCLFVFLDISK